MADKPQPETWRLAHKAATTSTGTDMTRIVLFIAGYTQSIANPPPRYMRPSSSAGF
jgi:hypothetical protein